MDATLNIDETKVADYIEQAHLETSHIQYNDENALSYTIDLAYYAARDHYTVIRELPTGKGFADLAFIPKTDKPALLVELKWNQDVNTAITQIKEKNYPSVLEKYKVNLLLVGITYDKKTYMQNRATLKLSLDLFFTTNLIYLLKRDVYLFNILTSTGFLPVFVWTQVFRPAQAFM